MPSHLFVPKHQKLTEKEAEEILERYNLSRNQLPKILKKDPAIASLDPKKGEIIKIMRTSPTAGKVIFYRVVVGG